MLPCAVAISPWLSPLSSNVPLISRRAGRFCARRAAAAQRNAPHRALAWLRLGCKFAPSFGDTYPALVHLSRALDDRWGAVEAAREASVRFPDHADAWMLLGEALQMVFRQDEALGAFEQALALEERADAAMAAC